MNAKHQLKSPRLFRDCISVLIVLALCLPLAESLRAQTLADAVDAPQLTWTAGGNLAWVGQTTVTHDGVDAARSGLITDDQESWLQTTVTGPGLLTFWWKASSEEVWDFLEFQVNGVLQNEISGEVDWQQRTVQLDAGNQTLRWRYTKDDIFSDGQDRGWVDMVSFTPASGPPLIVTQPQGRSVTEGANASFDVVASGAAPLFYQWFKNTTALSGANNSTYSLANVQISDAASYSVVATNTLGSVTSAPAVLVVNASLLDAGFAPGASGGGFPSVYALAVQADRKILVGGAFTSLGGQTRNNLGRINADGSMDLNFNPGAGGGVDTAVGALAVQPDGKILVGGEFTSLAGQTRNNIGRLNPDGTLDTTFNPGVSGGDFSLVYSMAVQADGKILVGGDFTTLGGQSRTNIGRLNADGTVDSTFNPKTDGPVYALVVQPDGKIVVGGYFTRLGGLSRTNLGRLNAAGTIDTTFSTGAGTDDAPDAAVFGLAMQADGKVLVGGAFTTLGGQARANLGRLNVNGTLDTTFNPGANGFVESFAVQTDGKILVGGAFTALGGQSRSHIGRLNTNGTLDSIFSPQPAGGSFATVSALALQADGKVLLGGSFTTLDGQPRLNLARLNNTEPATQTLGYAGTTVTWLRGGTSPEVLLTTFDHSSNGVAWTSLGAGTRTAGGWQRTGATVPAGRIIRARGFSAGSAGNRWFVEAYFGKPTFTQQPASRTNNFGTTAQLQVAGAGPEPLSYQWFKNGVALVDQGNIAGSTSDTLVLSQVSKSDEGGYSTVLTNASGSVTSSVAMLTVIDPRITQQPVGVVRSVGGSATFNATAVGTPPLSYQWYHDGVAVPGATASSLSLNNLTAAEAGMYTVVVSNPDGSTTSNPALLTVNGVTADSVFNPGSSHAVFSLAVQADGKILVGGAFTNLGGATRSRIGRLHPDGTVDSSFVAGEMAGGLFGPSVRTLAIQTNGQILIGGEFTSVGGQARYRIGRLNSNGALDTAFSPVVASFIDWFTTVHCLALQADGKILVGGAFDYLGGGERVNIGRLNANGTLDSFNPGLAYQDNSQPVYSLAVQADGKILAGGSFRELGRQARTNIGRVLATGALDTTFNPGANGDVQALALQSDGKILVGGGFSILAGQSRNYIGRLNTNGTIDASFNPGANGAVNSIAVQADGKILVGGSFTTLGGQSRNRIARLNADGTLDGTFNPGAGNTVFAIAAQADGKIVVGGNFSTLSGESRSGIGRLNNNGSASQDLNYTGSTITWLRGGTGPEVWRTSFDHSADGLAWTSIGAGTKIPGGWQRTAVSLPAGRTVRARGHVMGSYQNSGYFVESYFGKPIFLSQPASRTNGPNTTATFTAVASGSEPLTYHWQKDGAPLENQGNVTGADSSTLTLSEVFRAEEGAYRLIVSNVSGSVTSAVATLTVPNPLITQQPAGAHRNAGESVTFNVTAIGTPAPSFQWYHDGVAVTGAVGASLHLHNLSKADAGTYTVAVSNTDGSVTSAPAILSINAATLDNTFNPGVAGGYLGKVHALAVQADGKILVGGDFTSLGGQSRENLGRFNANGTVDGTFSAYATGGDSFTSASVFSLAVQTDGKILVGGSFDTLAGGSRTNLGRLHPDGTLDATFAVGVSGGDSFFGTYVYCFALQADGKILLGGDFTRVAGLTRNRLARLNSDGTVDSAFTAGANLPVKSLAVQPDGKILVGGAFTTLGGAARSRIGRLNANGTVDSTFTPGVTGGDETEVHALAVQADGKILVGGDFTTLRGLSRTNLGRLNADGTLDTSFNPAASAGIYYAYVYSLAVQADGKIVVGGNFTSLAGQSRSDIGRLNADGTLDNTFSPIVGNGEVLSLAVQPNGEILVGGYFDTFVGQSRSRIARLNGTDPATQSLTFANSTVTWLRGGTSPEVWRTSFEHSADGLSWMDLGAGTRIPGGWQKTGVSLPQAGTLRARGHVVGGDESSGWFAETILDLTPTMHLSLTREGSTLILNWTGGQGPYQVEQSTNLNIPNSWQSVGTPVPSNSMSLPIGSGNLFLRVRQP
jgi:uncharacterized delta-60 repeat protein